ncbi:MAG TPA: cytochrome c oxidase subunit 3, partial [Alphaproteobacteria bacterium]|nr:cytochrome c oxidase subunit 3 [Alphaproteobacteria bacterium]
MSDTPVYDLKGGKPHPYHLVPPSIWPLAGAFAAGLLALGAVLYMHGFEWNEWKIGLKGVLLGFAAVLAVMWYWWRDVVKEAVVEKAHTDETKVGFRYGMALFIASEVMFFVAFFWAFFDASINPSDVLGGTWPPQGVEGIEAFGLPFLMTLILLLSGCTVTWAHHAIIEGHQNEATKALLIT